MFATDRASILRQKSSFNTEQSAPAVHTPESGMGSAQNTNAIKNLPHIALLSAFLVGVECAINEMLVLGLVKATSAGAGLEIVLFLRACAFLNSRFVFLICFFSCLLASHSITARSQCAKSFLNILIFSNNLRKGRKIATATNDTITPPNTVASQADTAESAASPHIPTLIPRGIAPFDSISGTIDSAIVIKNTKNEEKAIRYYIAIIAPK